MYWAMKCWRIYTRCKHFERMLACKCESSSVCRCMYIYKGISKHFHYISMCGVVNRTSSPDDLNVLKVIDIQTRSSTFDMNPWYFSLQKQMVRCWIPSPKGHRDPHLPLHQCFAPFPLSLVSDPWTKLLLCFSVLILQIRTEILVQTNIII